MKTLIFTGSKVQLWSSVLALVCLTNLPAASRQSVPREHPRLLGSKERLVELAKERAEAYQRVVNVARKQNAGDHEKMISMALVSAIEEDASLGRDAIAIAMKYITGPIKVGHTPFGHDLARCAIVYDLCYDFWTDEERTQFHRCTNQTVDDNVNSETHVFHNGWYGYKNWGIGLACYAAYYENNSAPSILHELEREFKERAAPALELAGEGGGWAEGYYIHYWLYEWLFFCEAARYCENLDYYALAPRFFKKRAVAGMFEMYPGISDYGSRRPIPMGDGGGRVFGGDRDKALSARRILVNHYRDDPWHQAVHAFNESTPRSSVGNFAYKDFLWRDATVKEGDLHQFQLSHYSPGAGFIYARSSWEEDATYFFFHCGDRFTAHQHLDVGHFLIYKHEELIGDGGHYDSFGSVHDVNYHLRTIAHNTLLIFDPFETWEGIRAGSVTGNDGGQSHDWPHHNGAVSDAEAWRQGRELYDLGDIVDFEDHGNYLYAAADCTRAYSPSKLECFTRQIVFIRPGTFIIFDRVRSARDELKKTFLLQAMKTPAMNETNMNIVNGKGRLFIQTLLPANPVISLINNEQLYRYGGKTYLPERDTGPAPECRIEISPSVPSSTDYFLHILTAADSSVSSAPEWLMQNESAQVMTRLDDTIVAFSKNTLQCSIQLNQSLKTEDWESQ
ncbi:MAG: heparinase II/III family protein [Candidatus Omnitrophica bacterium]|nr:heparinase II/III family protein [Candidatus Omnitrophota bacterium]